MFHYIVGAITFAYSSIPLIHVFIGLMFMLNPRGFAQKGDPDFPLRYFGLAFVLIGGGIVLFGWTLGAMTAYAGRCIKRREKYLLCFILACVNCLHMPLGTILGIFTLIVLSRDSVKQLFEVNKSSSRPPAWTPGSTYR